MFNSIFASVLFFFAASSFSAVIPAERFQSDKFQLIWRTIGSLFSSTIEELQIGGTHTYGNAAVIKEGKNKGLPDPKIMIINPDPDAFQNNTITTDYFAIRGSGFNMNLLERLHEFSDLIQFKFKRIYINNVVLTLPIPDELPPEEHCFQSLFLSRGGVIFYRPSEEEFYNYVNSIGQNGPNLYQAYNRLLKKDGKIIFKSAGLSSLSQVLASGVFDKELSGLTDNEINTVLSSRAPDFTFINQAAQSFFLQLRETLTEVGQIHYLSPDLWKNIPNERPTKDFLYKLRMQIYLLEISGFTVTDVGIGLFNSYGFAKGNTTAYSVVIKATKN